MNFDHVLELSALAGTAFHVYVSQNMEVAFYHNF
jgi:hypothetical protein